MGQICILVGLESELLVVSNEFQREDAESDEGKDVIRSGEIGMRLEHGSNEDRDAEEKKYNILDNGYESEVKDMEEPSRNLRTKHNPTVIFVSTVHQSQRGPTNFDTNSHRLKRPRL